MSDRRPILGITLGDPAGVGPEVTALALNDFGMYKVCRPVVLGDEKALYQAVSSLDLGLEIKAVNDPANVTGTPGTIEFMPLSDLADDEIIPGRPTPGGGKAAAIYIETGAKMCLAEKIHGMVTSPISKEALNQAGYPYQGHTQFLAHLAGGPKVVMMLAGPKLRVVLVTIHVALADVPGLLSKEEILSVTKITNDVLKLYFGTEKPKLAAAGLNPHAGEGGMFGNEEKTIIEPAVREAVSQGIDLTGPYPPDTLFFRAAAGEFDAVVCMYHDQGLIPLKLMHFKDGVNVTLGLPFIRTSVDHGTAYDIAGKGIADPTSMMEAVKMAAGMAARRFIDKAGLET